jgi:hypothetical protein
VFLTTDGKNSMQQGQGPELLYIYIRHISNFIVIILFSIHVERESVKNTVLGLSITEKIWINKRSSSVKIF